MDETQITINQNDIKNISEEIGVDEADIKESIEKQKADKLFEESENQLKNEIDKKSGYVSKYKNSIRFLIRSFYMCPTKTDFGSITNINSFTDQNLIKIKVETEHPTVKDESSYEKGAVSETIEFNLDNRVDTEIIRNVLDHNNVSKPSELLDGKIPIKPSDLYSRQYSKTSFGFELDVCHSDMTLKDKTVRYFRRIFMRTNCLERASIYYGLSSRGEYEFNKNILLYIGLISLVPAILTSSNFISGLPLVFIGTYLLFVMVNMTYGLHDIVSSNRDERYYIKQKLEK